jgi:hypothetical protein
VNRGSANAEVGRRAARLQARGCGNVGILEDGCAGWRRRDIPPGPRAAPRPPRRHDRARPGPCSAGPRRPGSSPRVPERALRELKQAGRAARLVREPPPGPTPAPTRQRERGPHARTPAGGPGQHLAERRAHALQSRPPGRGPDGERRLRCLASVPPAGGQPARPARGVLRDRPPGRHPAGPPPRPPRPASGDVLAQLRSSAGRRGHQRRADPNRRACRPAHCRLASARRRGQRTSGTRSSCAPATGAIPEDRRGHRARPGGSPPDAFLRPS